MDLDPATLTAIVAFLASSGMLVGIVTYFWKLEPRLQTVENEQQDQAQKIANLREDHHPRITQNERDIAEMKSQLGVIEIQVRHNGDGIDRILDKIDK